MTENEWSRLCAGVHWLRLKNRDAYSALVREVKASGVEVAGWNAEVVEAASNGLVITEEREPKWE